MAASITDYASMQADTQDVEDGETPELCPFPACKGHPLTWIRVHTNRRNGNQLNEPYEGIHCARCGRIWRLDSEDL